MNTSLDLVRDFVNTCDLEEGLERLESPAATRRWLVERNVLAQNARVTGGDVRRLIDVREALRELLLVNNGIRVDTRRAAGVLDDAACRAGLAVRFMHGGGARVQPSARGVDGAIGWILASAAGAMAEGTWTRLKACRSNLCRWAFYDGARNQSRVWCSMRICGNREKARTFRRRHASTR